MDRITTSMCERAYGRENFARVLIEVDASNELVENVEVCYKSLVKSMNLRVEYTWKPSHCTNCKVFGHEVKTCSKREMPVDEKNEKAKDVGDNTGRMNDGNKRGKEWKEVKKYATNGASTSRSMGQQNNGNRREGNNGRYVPMEGNGKKIDDGLVMEGNNRGNNLQGKGVSNSNEVVKNKAKQHNDINTENSFYVLANEGMEEVKVRSDEWVPMRSKLDLACELGMQIADGEKFRWSMDLKKYYDDKCNAKVKGRMIEGLNWRISKLQKDISYGHSNIAMNAK
ncbi:hypothetical protein CTI12_AA388830 [Artemisia annua]|uniref:ATPase, F1/V1/A1 complex, alpha/beta subunit, Zinc knuckle CX2CX4HX4C n=1 Tax=Artemisia annua TaxID=35608 RepID=A0A2U1MEJ1_ARTAN|nr:hypothetical protein CTI12_AA388830 [Artemisia annua]